MLEDVVTGRYWVAGVKPKVKLESLLTCVQYKQSPRILDLKHFRQQLLGRCINIVEPILLLEFKVGKLSAGHH